MLDHAPGFRVRSGDACQNCQSAVGFSADQLRKILNNTAIRGSRTSPPSLWCDEGPFPDGSSDGMGRIEHAARSVSAVLHDRLGVVQSQVTR